MTQEQTYNSTVDPEEDQDFVKPFWLNETESKMWGWDYTEQKYLPVCCSDVPAVTCGPIEYEVFPWDEFFDNPSVMQSRVDNPAIDSVSMFINLGGHPSTWTPYLFVNPGFEENFEYANAYNGVLTNEWYAYYSDVYLDHWRFAFDLEQTYLRYDYRVHYSPGVTEIKRVIGNSFGSAYVESKYRGQPVLFEQWFDDNTTRADTTRGFSGYTFFGDQKGQPGPFFDNYSAVSYYRKLVFGVVKKSVTDYTTIRPEDVMCGFIYTGGASGGRADIIVNGQVRGTATSNVAVVDISIYLDTIMEGPLKQLTRLDSKHTGGMNEMEISLYDAAFNEVGTNGIFPNQTFDLISDLSFGDFYTGLMFNTFQVKTAVYFDLETTGETGFYFYPLTMYTDPGKPLVCGPSGPPALSDTYAFKTTVPNIEGLGQFGQNVYVLSEWGEGGASVAVLQRHTLELEDSLNLGGPGLRARGLYPFYDGIYVHGGHEEGDGSYVYRFATAYRFGLYHSYYSALTNVLDTDMSSGLAPKYEVIVADPLGTGTNANIHIRSHLTDVLDPGTAQHLMLTGPFVRASVAYPYGASYFFDYFVCAAKTTIASGNRLVLFGLNHNFDAIGWQKETPTGFSIDSSSVVTVSDFTHYVFVAVSYNMGSGRKGTAVAKIDANTGSVVWSKVLSFYATGTGNVSFPVSAYIGEGKATRLALVNGNEIMFCLSVDADSGNGIPAHVIVVRMTPSGDVDWASAIRTTGDVTLRGTTHDNEAFFIGIHDTASSDSYVCRLLNNGTYNGVAAPLQVIDVGALSATADLDFLFTDSAYGLSPAPFTVTRIHATPPAFSLAWDGATKSATVDLSAPNQVASQSVGAAAGVVTEELLAEDLSYWEIKVEDSNVCAIGIRSALDAPSTYADTSQGTCLLLHNSSGRVGANFIAGHSALSGFGPGTVLRFAFDRTTGKLWVSNDSPRWPAEGLPDQGMVPFGTVPPGDYKVYMWTATNVSMRLNNNVTNIYAPPEGFTVIN